MDTGVGATTILVLTDKDCLGLPLSATVAVNVDVPLLLGTPEMTPVDGVNERPAGRLPDVMDHEYGTLPPDALRLCE
jgi:hypothetical protein